jgi:ADP-heptose:LPS heptosyltransferase
MSDGTGTNHPGPLEYIDGSCFMIPAALAREVGIADPIFYGLFCCEDTDLSLRVRMRGYDLATVNAPIEHHEKPISDHGTNADLNPARNEAHRRLRERWGYYLRTKRFDARFIIRRRAGIGDVVLATRLPRLLKKRWPEVRITIATDWAEPFDNNPHIEKIVAADAFPDGCDYAIDLDGCYERTPKQNIWTSYAEALHVTTVPQLPDLYLNAYHETALRELLGPLISDHRPIAVLSVENTAWPGRNAPASLWPAAVAALKRWGFLTIAVGRTRTLGDHVDLDLGGRTGGARGERGILTVAALIKRAALFVGIDSCPFHLAQTFRTPSVVVFGCIRPEYRILHDRVYPVTAPGLDCIGCHHEYPPPRYDWSGCHRGDLACMNQLVPSDIIAKIETAMEVHDVV